MKPKAAPDGWGADKLSEFVGSTIQNTYTFFQQAPKLWARLVEVDAVFLKAAEHLHETDAVVPGLFLQRGHAAYSAAVRLEYVRSLYGQTINLGAHPNSMGTLTALAYEETMPSRPDAPAAA